MEIIDEEIQTAVLGGSELDYTLIEGKKIYAPGYTYKNLQKSYYQSEVPNGKYSCTIHSAITALSNNFGIDFTIEQRNEIINIAIKKGFKPDWGWVVKDACDFMSKWANDTLGLNTLYLRVPYTRFDEIAEMGYNIMTGYNAKMGMQQDRNDDGILGNADISTYGELKYGHAFNVINYSGALYGLDQYPGRTKHNLFKIHNLDKLAKAGVMFQSGYIFVDVKGMDIKAQIEWIKGLPLEEKIKALKNRRK